MRILSFFNSFRDEEISKKLEFLQNNKLFDKIPRRDLIYVLEALQERTYIRGETVFSEGDIGRALFMVMSGRIDLFKKMPDGSQKKVASINPGEFFGEMSLIEELPRTTSAIVGEDARMFLLFKVKLDSMLYSRPGIGVKISTRLAKIISARLRDMLKDMENRGEAK